MLLKTVCFNLDITISLPYSIRFPHISTLLQKHCNKKQETVEYMLKLCGYIYYQGTYTLQADNEKGAGCLQFIGIWSKSK